MVTRDILEITTVVADIGLEEISTQVSGQGDKTITEIKRNCER